MVLAQPVEQTRLYSIFAPILLLQSLGKDSWPSGSATMGSASPNQPETIIQDFRTELDILQNLMLQVRLYVDGRPWKAANRLWSWRVVASSYKSWISRSIRNSPHAKLCGSCC